MRSRRIALVTCSHSLLRWPPSFVSLADHSGCCSPPCLKKARGQINSCPRLHIRRPQFLHKERASPHFHRRQSTPRNNGASVSRLPKYFNRRVSLTTPPNSSTSPSAKTNRTASM